MRKTLLAPVAILAFAAPSFARDKQDKTVSQARPYLGSERCEKPGKMAGLIESINLD
jgi:hypothetical protein